MKVFIFLILTMTVSLMFAMPAQAAVYDAEQIATAIYYAEGGARAKKPFGVLSVPCDNYTSCRQICLNTIENTFTRWQIAGSPGDFLTFLANRYCPPGHCPDTAAWLKNVKYFMEKINAQEEICEP